ncbi:hypothetical protein LLG10_02690 [bacterium]|nr:hypothetical protein [bacterium]
MTSKKQFPWLYYFINGIFIVVAFIIFFNFMPKNWFQKQQAVFHSERERVEVKLAAKGFLAKEEILVTAPVDGKVKRLAIAGELQAKLNDIVEITSADGTVTKVKNQEEGFVTYIIDNCETTHTLANFTNKTLLLPEILNPPVKKEKVNDDQIVKKGEFLFKILKNTTIKYIFYIESDPFMQIQKGKEYVFAFSKPTSIMVPGTVETIIPAEGTAFYAVFDSSLYNDTMINDRSAEGNFYFGFVDGFRIPTAAMGIEENEKKEKKYFVYIQDDAKTIQKKYLHVSTYIPASKEYVITGYADENEKFSENDSIYKDKLLAEKMLSQSGE